MFEDLDGGAGEAAAVDDGRVVEFVGDDQVFLAENGGDGSSIGGEPGLEDDAGFDVFELGDLLFEIHVHLHGAGDGADGAGADAEFARGFDGGAAELGVGGEAQVIIGAEVDDFFAVEVRDGLLLAFEDFQIEVEMRGFHVFENVVKILELRAGCSGAHDVS